MTTNKDLGIRKKVELREVWPDEARDFTPWLAEHLSELGDALGMELELQAHEAPVGSYSLDILARDPGSDSPVVIENQLEATNHDHLGKLLTYAAGFDANVIVWIAKEFRDEHREALDLLNHRTGEDTQFFGVEVELWKIDDSRPAVNFKLVATPNEWRKQTVSNAQVTVSERRMHYKEFFQGLIASLMEKNFTGPRTARPEYEHSFASGFSAVSYRARFGWEGNPRVDLYIDRDKAWNKDVFDKLLESKAVIESELGESLGWDRLNDNKASRITIVRPGSIDDDEETLKEIHDWMVEKLLDFKRVFGPRLDELAR